MNRQNIESNLEFTLGTLQDRNGDNEMMTSLNQLENKLTHLKFMILNLYILVRTNSKNILALNGLSVTSLAIYDHKIQVFMIKNLSGEDQKYKVVSYQWLTHHLTILTYCIWVKKTLLGWIQVITLSINFIVPYFLKFLKFRCHKFMLINYFLCNIYLLNYFNETGEVNESLNLLLVESLGQLAYMYGIFNCIYLIWKYVKID